MVNNTYLTEAFEQLNKMPRMHDSKKPLKESSRRVLTESEMSPEDAEDTQVLRNIQLKLNMRPRSARLNRKELAVLDKYGLYYDKYNAVLSYTESGAPFYGIRNVRTKANLADSARKQQDRQLARRGTDSAVRDARGRYRDMETALYHRDGARQELDRLDDKNRSSYAPNEFNYFQGPQTADSLAKNIDSIKSGREFDRNYAQARVDRHQKEINKLLRRDESLKESNVQSSYEGYKSKIQRAYDNFDTATVTKKDAVNGNISIGINRDCADYVGSLAKALDKFGIGYKIYCGVAIPDTDKVDPTDAQQMIKYRNLGPNHCWLVDEYGRRFEIPGYSKKITGKEINISKNESYNFLAEADDDLKIYYRKNGKWITKDGEELDFDGVDQSESNNKDLKESNSNIQDIKTKISDFLFDYFDEHFLSEATELVEENFPNYNPEWCSDNDESSTYNILSDLVDDLVESLFYYAND